MNQITIILIAKCEFHINIITKKEYFLTFSLKEENFNFEILRGTCV